MQLSRREVAVSIIGDSLDDLDDTLANCCAHVSLLLLRVCAAELTVQWNNPTNENSGCVDFYR
jgi:hypothetical protein